MVFGLGFCRCAACLLPPPRDTHEKGLRLFHGYPRALPHGGGRSSVIIGWVTGFALGVLTIETSPSPAGRSPQRAGTHAKCGRILHGARGRVGEGVGDVVDESKFRFFNGLLPSPHPLSRPADEQCLSQRDGNSSRSKRGAYSLTCKHALKRLAQQKTARPKPRAEPRTIPTTTNNKRTHEPYHPRH